MAMLLMMMIAMGVLTVHLDDYHEDGDDPSDDDSDYGDDGDVYEGNKTGRQAAGAGEWPSALVPVKEYSHIAQTNTAQILPAYCSFSLKCC